jgi:2,4-dienoyl-CoA reductase-like NADH-dependent reductase (Old Yellow Enzyme family)
LHVSLTDFWSKPNKGFDGTRSRIELLQDSIGDRVPLIGVGSIYTAEDAHKALASGIPLIGLGRELLIDPEWVQKIEDGREDEIVTELAIDKQNELDMPSPLWQRILNNPGWVPGI